jgi:recombination protein RecA
MVVAQREIIRSGETGYVIFFDYEKTFDGKYAKSLGLDPEHESFIYLMPNTFEEGANIYRELLATGEVRLAVFDSVAAMITEKEIAADTGASKVADRAKVMHQFCRQITPVLARTNSTAIFLNHVMEKVDATWAGQQLAARGIKQYTRPGGTALDFYSSLTLEFKQQKFHKVKEFDALENAVVETIRQTDVLMSIVKNKVGDPQGKVVLRVRFGKGFSQAFSVEQILLAHNLITKSSAWYYVDENLLTEGLKAKAKDGVLGFNGEEKLLSAMEKNPEWLDLLENKAKELLADLNPENGEINFEDSTAVSASEVDEILGTGD